MVRIRGPVGLQSEGTNFGVLQGGKEGQLRTGTVTRVDNSGRAVIGIDPLLELNEIRIPLAMANTLTGITHVTEHNVAAFKAQARNPPRYACAQTDGLTNNIVVH
jgi:DNA-directed RNA polymerase beta' subunit